MCSDDMQMFILPTLLAIYIRLLRSCLDTIPTSDPTHAASACYPASHPSGNCTDVLSHLDDGPWRDNLPGAMQSIVLHSTTGLSTRAIIIPRWATLVIKVTFRSSESTRGRLPISRLASALRKSTI
ncbi:hypothetical protein JOM56_009374 [Amanita muscaria]